MKERLQSDLPTVEILDLQRVKSRLWKATHLFHPDDLSAAEVFVREQAGKIQAGGVKGVIHVPSSCSLPPRTG